MKRTFCVSLLCLLCAAAMTVPSYAGVAAPLTQYRTSYNESNFFDFSVKGNILTVSGTVNDRKIGWMSILFEDEKLDYAFPVTAGSNFTKTYKLSSYEKKEEPLNLSIAVGEDHYGMYQYLYWGEDVVLEYRDGQWGFDIEEEILENNLEYHKEWINPGDAFDTEIEDRIAVLSDQIVGEETDEYEKIRLIHVWVADHLYYDYDVLEGKVDRPAYEEINDILVKRSAVCAGYAFLTEALIEAQGIPCLFALGYSPGAEDNDSQDSRWTEEEKAEETPNHGWNEAYVDGRWVMMDTTWDSRNEYRDGVFHYGGAPYTIHFDVSEEQFSKNHKLLGWLDELEIDIPSVWAKKEIKECFVQELIPYELQTDYSQKITRQEFCTLVIRLLEKKTGKTAEALLPATSSAITSPVATPSAILPSGGTATFTDCSDPDVLAAYALGIVKGKKEGVFDPEGAITRQEAAVMLKNTAEVLGIGETTTSETEFADGETIASWAEDAVSFVAGLTDPESGSLVMGGTGGGKFSPSGMYSREQAYCTMLRLYHVKQPTVE